jgi:hypothetical protein
MPISFHQKTWHDAWYHSLGSLDPFTDLELIATTASTKNYHAGQADTILGELYDFLAGLGMSL